jgi:hypothetical protein
MTKRSVTTLLIIAFHAAVILLCRSEVRAQNRNAVYVEIGGSAYSYSINYERTFSNNILARGGIGVTNGNFIVPLTAGRYFGNGNHHAEMSLGLAYVHGRINPNDLYQETIRRNQYFATGFLGYRYQNPDKAFLLRAGYTPLYKIHDSYSPFDDHFWFHWAGISFGYMF